MRSLSIKESFAKLITLFQVASAVRWVRRTTTFTAAILFCCLYLRALHGGKGSPMAPVAYFQAGFPFKLRLLLPWLLYRFSHVPAPGADPLLESLGFRFGFTLLVTLGCLSFLRPFASRISPAEDSKRVTVFFLALLYQHYCFFVAEFGARYFLASATWVVSDLPSILFYLITILLLTHESRPTRLAGYALALLFSLNRETIVLAPLHAMAIAWIHHRSRIAALLCLATAILLGHLALAIVLGGRATSVSFDAWPANLDTIRHTPVVVLTMGYGILVWLPFLFPRLPRKEKLICASSIPFVAALCKAGLLREPRIFNELVPFMALLMSDGSRVVEAWARRRGFIRNLSEEAA